MYRGIPSDSRRPTPTARKAGVLEVVKRASILRTSEVSGQKQAEIGEGGAPLAGQAYGLIRRAILRGDIAPGARLKMDTLQREFDVSSSPLREALSRLTAEGLAYNDDRRGFRAALVSTEDLNDITAFRRNIEPITLRESMELGGDEWEGAVVASFHRLERLESRASHKQFYYTDEWADRHKDFHIALISCCPSRRQVALCSMLFDQVERYRRLSIGIRKKPKRDHASEHRAIMKAALERNFDEAASLLRAHMQSLLRVLIDKSTLNVELLEAACQRGPDR